MQDVIIVRNLQGTRQLLPVAVVVKFVVTGKCNEDPKACTQWVEDLGSSIDPNLEQKSKHNEHQHGVTSVEIKAWLSRCITLLFSLYWPKFLVKVNSDLRSNDLDEQEFYDINVKMLL